MPKVHIALIAIALAMPACGGEVRRFEPQPVGGPPRVQVDVALEHAQQFETDVPSRPAGSQEEQAAAAYILGVLQQNGYLARLESVPVGDLVRSTNVIAQPAGGEDPAAVVAVPYGTGPGAPEDATAIGMFLEVTRALNVAAPGHKVQFAALGAEFTDAEGGNLGTRRLARLLLDEDKDPLIVELGELRRGAPLVADGAEAADLLQHADAEPTATAVLRSRDIFEEAGFRRLLVAGDPDDVGAALLAFLAALPR